MLNEIVTVNINGANFNPPAALSVFDPHDGGKTKHVKGAILYGRNGTGKSTIARAFYKIAGGTTSTISSVSLYGDNGQPIILTEVDKKHIFVFNEDFIDRNVRLQADHLETIVMLGQAADLAQKIVSAEEARETAKSELDKADLDFKEFNSYENPKAPNYYLIRIGNALRGDDGWAGRDRQIYQARKNTGVTDDTYKQFLKRKPSKTKAELLVEFESKLEDLEAARTGSKTIDSPIPQLPASYNQYDDTIIQALLSETIEKPELSEREIKLLSIVKNGGINDLQGRMAVLQDESTTECPFCFRHLNSEEKDYLIKSIEKVLSKAVDDHVKALRSQIFGDIIIDLSPYSALYGYQECSDLIAAINSAIHDNNDYLTQKINNPYDSIIIENGVISVLINQLLTKLNELEEIRVKYNNEAKKTQPIIKELVDINSDIAYYDIIDLVEQYNKQLEAASLAQKAFEDAQTHYKEKCNAVEVLESQRRNTKVALDSINACLSYIFFSDERLKIEYEDGVYKLRSHGRRVEPCNVSIGERNAIALSYYFISILEGKDEGIAYNDEYLLIIDDPISSFDNENRIGILSFLKYKLSDFLESNINTKALVMTHDLMTTYDLQKVFDEILDSCKKKGWTQLTSHGLKYNKLELKNNTVEPFTNKRHEYTELLKDIYNYALGKASQQEMIIGNLIRQVLEAFSTFQYKKGIEEVSTDQDILSLLQDADYIKYYNNLMYRLVLHGGSHREEQIKTMKDFNFYSIISDNEKKRTAVDVLCFIYLLNKKHILEHLKEYTDAESHFVSWCQDIKAKAATM